jgi:hypothetical protein
MSGCIGLADRPPSALGCYLESRTHRHRNQLCDNVAIVRLSGVALVRNQSVERLEFAVGPATVLVGKKRRVINGVFRARLFAAVSISATSTSDVTSLKLGRTGCQRSMPFSAANAKSSPGWGGISMFRCTTVDAPTGRESGVRNV